MLKQSHWRELDGLRGVAAALVMFHHFLISLPPPNTAYAAVYAVLSQGWIGVEVFFVISGFLVTKSLRDTWGSPRFFVSFYVRRALRILPLLFCLLSLYYGALFFVPGAISPLLAETLTHYWYFFWFNLTNLLPFYRVSTSSLTHLWSLAIEEQFYLLWPVALTLTPFRFHRRLCLGLWAGNLLCRWILFAKGWPGSLLYYITPGRLDGLLLGAWYFIVSSEGDARTARWVRSPYLVVPCLLGLVGLAWREGFSHDNPGMAVFGYSALALISAAWISDLVENRERAFGAKVLNLPMVQMLGRYSYALYLLNYPIWYLVNKSGVGRRVLSLGGLPAEVTQLLYLALLCLLTVGTAALTFKFIERPAQSLARFFPRAERKDTVAAHGT